MADKQIDLTFRELIAMLEKQQKEIIELRAHNQTLQSAIAQLRSDTGERLFALEKPRRIDLDGNVILRDGK
jgi:hypothetical protein